MQVVNLIFYGVCKFVHKSPLKGGGGPPLGGGGAHPQSVTSRQPCRNRPAEFARTSLSAWGLPTPIVALACIGNVDIQVFFWCRRVTLFHTAFASLYF